MFSLITLDSPWQDALRARPLLADRINAFRPEFWERPQALLRELFPGDAGVLDGLLKEASMWAVPPADSPWEDLSIAHLLDFLTQNHREFFQVVVADARQLFSMRKQSDPETEALGRDFEAFAAELRARADSDERELFHRVLRYEACLRDPGVNPEFSAGSLRTAVAYRTQQAGQEAPRALSGLIDRLRETEAARGGDPWLGLLERRLEEFRDRLAEHERLKAEVLYPLALKAEKTLYNLSIDGHGARRAAIAAA